MNPYQYRPLSGPRCTRVIRLHPGTTKDPSCLLSCDLVEIDLDDPPEYLALSYTWKGETPSEPLAIGNARGNTSQAAGSQLLITPNCAAALTAFRKSLRRLINRRKSLTLWIDAICIDQGSNDDKSTQVGMMAEIYQHAKRVIVWLGNRDSPPILRPLICSVACAALPMVSFFTWARYRKAFRWLQPEFLQLLLKRLVANFILDKCCNRSTVDAIMSSSYWTRAWTLQEFANARVSILCQNSNMISVASMMEMIRHSDELSIDEIPVIHGDVYQDCRAFGSFTNDAILVHDSSLQEFLRLQAANPRDRIFAFRTLSPDVFGKIEVDYQRPLHDLFTETSMVFMKETESLHLLYYASLGRTSPGTGSMPSWSFDFGTKDLHECYRGQHMDRHQSFEASGLSLIRPRMRFSQAGLSLRVIGKGVGVIGDVTSKIDPLNNSWLMEQTAMEDESRQQVDDDGTSSLSSTEDDSRSRLIKLMVPLISTQHRERGATFRSEAKMAKALFELMQSIAGVGDSEPVTVPSLAPNATFEDLFEALYDDWGLCFTIKYRIGEGRLFLTTDGRAGFGVPRISEDDEVFLIAGVKHPFVLRPHGDSGEYKLVGPAVITGMMEGELWPDDESELRDIDIV
ncbi:hypothetical protein K456DRAFT_1900377 [Colletotrichum gloeosporioides 23]|nr:hypothetical protein K456DRAFT_1900377 [Colletotrichum gloeosporioides 23]